MYPKPRREVSDRIRRAAYERDGRCLVCGQHLTGETVHCHHIQSRGAGGADKLTNVISLCPECHAAVHNGVVVLDGQRINVDDHVMYWLLKLNCHYMLYDALQLGSAADSQVARLLWGRYRAEPHRKELFSVNGNPDRR